MDFHISYDEERNGIAVRAENMEDLFVFLSLIVAGNLSIALLQLSKQC